MTDSKSLRMDGVSFADSISYHDDTVSLGGISRESRRQRQMDKLKKRKEFTTEHRTLLFRPRVYDSWREGDLDFDTAERERILKDIAAKEQRLQEKRRKRLEDGGPEDLSDSSEENEVVTELDKLKSRKQREDEFREKLERDKKKQEEEDMLEMEEKLASELQNPSVYGWFYTDGYYDNAPYFGVREDLVEKLNSAQQEWYEKWHSKYPETFTSMFKRFFWPPKYLFKLSTLRTRGSYLDFPEVIADWPKEVEVNFEREPREYITNRHELFGVSEEQKEKDAEELAAEEQEQKEKELLEGTDKSSTKKKGGKKKGKIGKILNKGGKLKLKPRIYFNDSSASDARSTRSTRSARSITSTKSRSFTNLFGGERKRNKVVPVYTKFH